MQRVTFIILLFATIITSSQAQTSLNFNTLRWLQTTTFDSTAKEQACANIPKNYTGIKIFDTVNAYVDSLNLTNPNSATGNSFLINLLLQGSISGLQGFLTEIGIYLAMIALGIIALIMWPFMWCCCCCNCCLFNDNLKKGWCGFINLLLALLFLSLIVITAIVGIAQSQIFVQYFNGSICSLLTFFDTSVLGENTQKVPKWGGSKGISDTLVSSLEAIRKTQNSYVTLPSSSVTTNDNNYNSNINSLITSYAISSPNPGGPTETPVYGSQFADRTAQSTFIGQISLEKANTIDLFVGVLSDLDSIMQEINSPSSGFTTGITDIESMMSGFNQLINSLSSTVANNVLSIQKTASKVILLIFQILYGIFIGLAGGSISVLLVYLFCKCYSLKIIIHLFWNLLFLLTILGFIIGALLGVFGVIGNEFIPTFNYIVSPEFLKSGSSPFGSPEMSAYLDRCINGDGDLIAEMNIDPSTGPAKYLNDLVQLSVKINDLKTKINAISNSIVIPPMITQMTGFENNIDSTLQSYQTVLNQINTDLNGCSLSNRYYVSGQTNSAGWTEITPSSIFVYPTCQPGSVPMNTRLDTVKSSVNANQAKINSLKTDLNTLKNDYNALINLIQNDFTSADDYTNGLFNIFNSITGSNSLFSMFNCKFIRTDLMNFLDQFGNHFASVSRIIGICCLICSCGSFLGVFFLMKTIYYYSKNARKEEGCVDEKNSGMDSHCRTENMKLKDNVVVYSS